MSRRNGNRAESDGGLILVRDLDERLGFSDLIAQHVIDPRGKNTQFPLADLVRQSVYRRLASYENVNDAERLSHDPTFRLIGSEQLWERRGGSDVSSALVRDGATDPRQESHGAGRHQPGAAREGGSDGVLAAGGA